MRAIIADDEAPAREEIVYLLGLLEGVEVVGQAADGPAAWKAIGELSPDVVFLDIRMPGLSGIELAQTIKTLPKPPVVIFVTAYDKYAVEAFDAEALDYLLKPVEEERLKASIDRARKLIEAKDTSFLNRLEDVFERISRSRPPLKKLSVKKAARIHLLDPEDVLYFFVEEGLIRAVGKEISGTVGYRSLEELETELKDSNFFRSHRAYFVNLNSIHQITKAKEGAWELAMANRDIVPLSRKQAKKLRKFIKW